MNITYYIAQSKDNDVVIPGYRLDYNIYAIRLQYNSLMKLVFPPEKVGGVLPHSQ